MDFGGNNAEFWQMKIKSLQLINFKRFTDLTLQGIPENAKLVLLIGSNGSGKSSVFDAFEAVSALKKGGNFTDEFTSYYKKNKTLPFSANIEIYDKGFITRTDTGWLQPPNKEVLDIHNFYGRTSFRQIPKLQRTQMGQLGSIDYGKDSDRPKMYIEKDNRFESDIELITEYILKDFFRSDRSNRQIKERYIDPINLALEHVFNKDNGTKLRLIEIIPPLEGKVAQINFEKGNSEIHYNYLSAGEKEVVNIFFNLLSRREFFQDTVYFLDELDLHLNTALQFNLIKEIVESWIPEKCQLWTASHSLGFIQYAKESEQAVIFDFDDYDFDESKLLVPEQKDSSDVYEIAVSKAILPSLFKDYTIYFVENKDRNYYSSISITHILFVQANDKKTVYHKAKNGEFHGIIDRDFLTDDDIKEIEKQYLKLRILRLYSIENYLYHPDNLEEYYSTQNKPFNIADYRTGISKEKDSVLNEIKRKLAVVRMSYPFFEEPEFKKTLNQKRFRSEAENFAQVQVLEEYLDSSEFDVFYKVFPMKDYATQLKERQNINKSDLSKTEWFKTQIEDLLK